MKLRILIALALLPVGCARLQGLRALDRTGVGTSPAPSTEWVAPPDAIRSAPVEKAPTITLPDPAEGPLTLQRVLDIALDNNPATREAWLQAKIAAAGLASEKSSQLPSLDLGAKLSRTHSGALGSRAAFSQTTWGPSLGLTWLLFDFGGRSARIDQAREALIAADFSHNQAIQNVVLRTEQAYYQVLAAKALLAAQNATLKERKKSLEAAEGRHDSGVATIADVLQARTALSQAQLTYDTIDGSLRAVEGALATAAGLDPTTRFEVGTLPEVVPDQKLESAIDKLIENAEKQRPELAAARARAASAEGRVREMRAQGLPTVSLSGSTGMTYYTAETTHAVPYAAVVGIDFPLFTGWKNTWDLRQAQEQAKLAHEQVRDLAQQIALQVWTSYYAVQTARQRLVTSHDLLKSAEQSAEVARARYDEGVGTIIDALTAEAALESARAQEVQSRADWFLALAQLAHDTGKLSHENGAGR